MGKGIAVSIRNMWERLKDEDGENHVTFLLSCTILWRCV